MIFYRLSRYLKYRPLIEYSMRLLNFATSGDLAIGDPYWCFLIDKGFEVFLNVPFRGNKAYVDLDAGLDQVKKLAIERMKIVEQQGCELVSKDRRGNSELESLLMDFYWIQDSENGPEKNLVKIDLRDPNTFKLLALLMRNKKSLDGGKKSLANLFGNTIRMLVKHRNVVGDGVVITTKDENDNDMEIDPMAFLREHRLIEGDPLTAPEDFNPMVAILENMPRLNDERPALRALYEEGNIPWFVYGTLRFDCPGDHITPDGEEIEEPRALEFFVLGRPTE